MRNVRYLHKTIWMVFILSSITKLANAQVARCIDSLTVSPGPFLCTFDLVPSDINNGSEDYDQLTVSPNSLTEGSHTVTLTVSQNNGNSSSCNCIVTVIDATIPVVVLKQNIDLSLDADNSVAILPEVIDGGSYDQCHSITYSVNPSIADCDSPNPLQVFLTVTDEVGNSNSGWTYVNIIQNKNRTKTLACNDMINVEVPVIGQVEVTSDLVLEGGPYACPNYYQVQLSYNGVMLDQPLVDSDDVGKTFLCSIIDPETSNACWGLLNVIGLECDYVFNICDTKSRCEPLGDCTSGHNADDDVEWPCDIVIDNATTELMSNHSPQALANFLNVSIDEVKPILFTDDCAVTGVTYTDVEFNIQNGGKVFHRTFSLQNWSIANQPIVQYTQKIFLTPSVDTLCNICDLFAWNTPIGDCNSGHSLNDAVEWPADITVSSSNVSPYDLFLNPNVNPNDAKPRIRETCLGYAMAYTDIVNEIDTTHSTVSRTWTVINFITNHVHNYTQVISINSPTQQERTVCFENVEQKAIENVQLYENKILENEICNSFLFDESHSEIFPYKEDDLDEGVDIADYLLLYDHILGIKPLDNVLSVAADLNNDDKLTSADVVLLKQIIDHTITSLPEYEQSWMFLNKNDIYSRAIKSSNSFNTMAILPLVKSADISSPYTNYHFLGLKLGDLDNSYHNNDVVYPKVSKLVITDQVINSGETYHIKLKTKVDHRIKGFYIELEMNDAIEVSSIFSFLPDLMVIDKGNHYEISWLAGNLISSDGTGINANEALILIDFVAKKNAVLHDIIKINEVNNKLVEGGSRGTSRPTLEFSNTIPTSTSDLSENRIAVYPNPAFELLSFNSTLSLVQLTIYDLSGKSVLISNDLSNNSIDISQLKAGMYLLNFVSSDGNQFIKKLIKL